ncbi:Arginine/agmatine antiporter [Vibrio stylophorae]|uniref:Arginine/agmatine antiporter n=2 Tax=Vibrio stylophorae TaxID=659351 RepID=A0ABN8DTM2_9VIBR|nr:Arginine/agmatine antiporter [Vibrio stylophorae]
MGLVALTIMTASNMMGSGVFMLPSSLANIGSISLWGWVVTFFGVLALALVFAKLSIISPKHGGIVANVGTAFGPYVGLQSSLFYWLSTWIGNCALLVTGVGYLSFFFPSLSDPLHAAFAAIAILWIFVLLGLQGAKVVGYAQIFTGLCMVTVVLSVGIFGWFDFSPDRYMASFNVSGDSNAHAIMTAASVSLWGFLGIESASVSTGQAENPKRNIPLATLIGLSIAALCYVSSSNVIMGVLPHDQLIVSGSPFADTARHMWGETAGQIISAMVIIACLGAMPGWQILQTEVPRSAAKEGLFPQFFAKTNKRNVPYLGLIFTACLMSVVLLLTVSPNLEKQFSNIILLAISAGLIPYAFAAIALPVLMVRFGTGRGWMFILFCLLSCIGLSFVLFALVGSGAKPLLLAIIIQILTIPLYLMVVIRQASNTAAALDNAEAPAEV